MKNDFWVTHEAICQLADRLTRGPKIVTHGHPCIILYFLHERLQIHYFVDAYPVLLQYFDYGNKTIAGNTIKVTKLLHPPTNE